MLSHLCDPETLLPLTYLISGGYEPRGIILMNLNRTVGLASSLQLDLTVKTFPSVRKNK